MPEHTHIRFIRLAEVMRITSISRSQIYKLEADGQFPAKVKLGAISVAWVEEEVQTWCRARLSAARPDQSPS